MSTGRITIPTDANFVEGTKKFIKKWGADAVRDCDGTELPENAGSLAPEVYKTYFLARSNNAWAYAHPEAVENVALGSEYQLAKGDVIEIDLLKGLSKDQFEVNEQSKSYWQVFDRTTNKETDEWKYDSKKKAVIVKNAEYMHEYSVNFFARCLWDATQIYNYTANGWTIEKDRDIDPIHPEAKKLMKDDLTEWLKNNPQVTVVRFTTFFYHFFLLYNDKNKHKQFDWFGYAMSASPEMFEAFYKKYGYRIMLEDIVDGGYYANHFRTPSRVVKDYMHLVQELVAKTAKEMVDVTHAYGKKAMMFLGDNWTGAEPYGPYFKDMGLDAVVGSVNSGATLRMLSEIPYVKYTEARFMPYFFPDTLNDDKAASKARKDNWIAERRAILRKPVDRIGFGGYLKLADKLPTFTETVEKICDEFRTICDNIGKTKPYSTSKIAILNAWGKEKSWMVQMSCQDAPYQKIYSYQSVLEALCGLPVEVDFINFDDVKNGALQGYDAVMNYGDRDTAFSGDTCWLDGEAVAAVRKFVYEGGGFIGIGEPTAVHNGGKFFQLSDVMGVEEENGLSLSVNKYFNHKTKGHFILDDVAGEIGYGGNIDHIYALEGAKVLDVKFDKDFPIKTESDFAGGVNCGHVKIAVNEFGKGRSFYMTGMKYCAENTRLLYRALLWCAKKEDCVKKAFTTNVYTECDYYKDKNLYALVNNSDKEQKTTFYDIKGNAADYTLKPYQLVWI